MTRLELIDALSCAEEEEILLESDGWLCDFEIERVEESFDGFDTVSPACLKIVAKKDDRKEDIWEE
jgi:hypothetical protein